MWKCSRCSECLGLDAYPRHPGKTGTPTEKTKLSTTNIHITHMTLVIIYYRRELSCSHTKFLTASFQIYMSVFFSLHFRNPYNSVSSILITMRSLSVILIAALVLLLAWSGQTNAQIVVSGANNVAVALGQQTCRWVRNCALQNFYILNIQQTLLLLNNYKYDHNR